MEQDTYRWDAADYAAHSSAQFAWADELVSKVKLQGHEVVLDVGCGDGKVSAMLAGKVPDGAVVAIDQDPDMIRLARTQYSQQAFPNLTFIRMDVEELDAANRFDIVFSNAALHWLRDHQLALANIRQALKQGGRFLLQMGGQGNAAKIILVIEALMEQDRWRAYFRDFAFPYGFFGPEEYRLWLTRAGLAVKRADLIPKDMRQEGLDGLAGWIRTTWLPYTTKVPSDQREEFISALVKAYLQRYPMDEDGFCHVAMMRLEVEGYKP